MQLLQQHLSPLKEELKKIGKTKNLTNEQRSNLQTIMLELCDNKDSWLPDWALICEQPETVHTLYVADDHGPMINIITWQAGVSGLAHDHNTWGMVACLYGQEANTAWKCSSRCDENNICRLEKTTSTTCTAGDILHIEYDDIHSIENITPIADNNGTAVSLHIYGHDLRQTNRKLYCLETGKISLNNNTEFELSENWRQHYKTTNTETI